MTLLLMSSTEATVQVPMELPTSVPTDSQAYSSDSSGNEYLSGSSSSLRKSPLPPAFNNNNTTSTLASNPHQEPSSLLLSGTTSPDMLPVSTKSLIMEGFSYVHLANNRYPKIVPMEVQVVDVDQNRKLIIVSLYTKISSIIYHAASGAILHSYDTEPVFNIHQPGHIQELLPETSIADLMSQPPPVRKKLIGRRANGEQVLLSTRTEETAIDPNRPKDHYVSTLSEITRWMVPLVVVSHNFIILEYNTFFLDVFGFTDWRKHPLTEFLKKDDRYGFVFTERISNIAIPVKFEKLEPAFTVHNWHKGLSWYAIVPLNLPDCWVRYIPQMDDYVADMQLSAEIFSGYSKLSENKVTVKLIALQSNLEFTALQRLLELRHPNIAVIEGVFLKEYVAFVVARCPGKSLAKILEAQIFVPPDHAIAVLVRLVSALWFCHHERKISHGNISFDNVLVDEKWNPYLTGFGPRSSTDGNPERFREDIRQLPSIFLALLSGLARPPPEFFRETLVHHSVEIRELVNLLHSPQCTLKDIFSHQAVQNFLKAHQMKPTFY
eukprot:CAMPEP_0168554696 /NCGR_PEP_ID=MMETSP0413-20121227/7921_1 /TAXON_ID=136452 /ORGANISM="Filamoeba nolandi, Strain NC-AS-23-1" /LENGTH=549 /DNA_ID=CAMNT_0008585461 /DNA_START=1097 /DNA_END=2746 /DNA_ORIENTATION=-